jgi:8-oxo-dGTP pyrophosphatase MutT (NUDIX family)
VPNITNTPIITYARNVRNMTVVLSSPNLWNARNMARRLVGSGEAADAAGVSINTLLRWARDGLIQPDDRTLGGHYRWDLDNLRQQLAAKKLGNGAGETFGPQPIVAVIVTSRRGVLIAKRRDERPLWTFVSGEIEPEESPADAGVREVKEEATLEIRAGQMLGTRIHPVTGRVMIYMAGHPVGGTDVHVGDDQELAEVRWATFAEAEELMPTMFGPVRDWLRRELVA